MKTIYSKNHILRNSKTELYGGELVRPFECPERMEYILNQIHKENLGEILEPHEIDLDIIYESYINALSKSAIIYDFELE